MFQRKTTKKDAENSAYLHENLTDMIQIVAEISHQLTTNLNLEELIDRAPLIIQQNLRYEQVVLYLLDVKQQQFSLRVVANANHGQVIRSYPSPNEVGLAYMAVQETRTIRIGDLAEEAPSYYKSKPLNIHAALHIPLQRGERLLGVLSFGVIKPYSFNDDVTTILKTLAAQLTILIDQSRQHSHVASNLLDQNNEPLLKQAYDMQTIVPGIQSLARVHEVFDKIVKGVVDGLGYEGAMLAVLDEENLTLPVQAFFFSGWISRLNLLEKAEKALGIQVVGTSASLIKDPFNLGVKSCLSGELQITADLYDLFRPAVDQTLSRGLQKLSGVKTCISIPLLVKNKVVGNLYAATKKEEISERDLNNLRVFATNAAIAVQNTILYEHVSQELETRKAELTQLRGIEIVISSSLDLAEVLERILHGALEMTTAEYGQVVLTGQYASDLVRRVSYPERLDSANDNKLGLTELIMRDKKPKLINNIDDLTAVEDKELRRLINDDDGLYARMRSYLGVPISLGDDLIGIIHIASQEASAFDKQSLDLLEQLAVQAAIAITNIHRFKEQQEAEKRLSTANQVAAMGDIASNMVHSINNWIGSIRADALYLIDEYHQNKIDPAESLVILDDILKNAQKTLSKAEKIRQPFQLLDRDPIDINECILTVLAENQGELAILDTIDQDLQETLPAIMATQRMEQVFDNVIKNALQAMVAQDNKRVLKFVTQISSDGQYAEIMIADSGPGLPSTISETDIFKLGKTSRQSGMGYGLWWCDTYLKRIGGDIQLVENKPTGCKFLIRLPI